MPDVVQTRAGKLQGEPIAVGERRVRRFLGVPYAAPPVGPLRFRAPAPVTPWSGVRPARSHGASAPQLPGLLGDVPPIDEDCLHLSLWVPEATQPKPVMVWLHGGGFTSGSAGQPMCDGAQLAARGDVIVVNVNYRLGVLGFCFLEGLLPDALPDTANLGLRDQLAALCWVKDNIAAFGGDPGNVTVFGSSAGAMCLSAMLATPRARGLFARAIAQSGAADHVIQRDDACEVAERLFRALGASTRAPERLWQASVSELLEAQPACVRHTIRRGHPGCYQQTRQMGLGLVADGTLLPEDVRGALAEGIVVVPLIVGTNADEWHFYVQLADRGKLALDVDSLRKVCESRVPGFGGRAAMRYLELPELLGHAPWEVFSAFETDRSFFVPACRLADLQAQHAPTYAYLFERRSPLCDGQLGACHALETPYVLGSIDTPFGRALCGEGPAARRVSDALVATWARFAHTGSPGEVLGTHWSPYEPTRRDTLRLEDAAALVSDPRRERRSLWAL